MEILATTNCAGWILNELISVSLYLWKNVIIDTIDHIRHHSTSAMCICVYLHVHMCTFVCVNFVCKCVRIFLAQEFSNQLNYQCTCIQGRIYLCHIRLTYSTCRPPVVITTLDSCDRTYIMEYHLCWCLTVVYYMVWKYKYILPEVVSGLICTCMCAYL